jgi:hypothetical protein
VRKAFTNRNHYNPCFWTALWNVQYFDALVTRSQASFQPREQHILALNVRSNKIYATTVENVHYHKKLGVAEITPESMKRFCQRWTPKDYDRLARYVDEHPDSLWLDFEDILTAIEERGGYDCLIEAARSGAISSPEHKGFLTCVLIIHAMRSHEMMTSMIDLSGQLGLDKWEYFWLLKHAWGNQLILARAATPLAAGQWVLYRTRDHRFPLCDSPVMIGPHSVMAALSPRLLLEINLDVLTPEDQWIIRDGISPSKYREFRRRAIANSFKEIIFADQQELERWRSLPEFNIRYAALADQNNTQQLVAEAAGRVVWGLGGFGRVPPEFERWLVETGRL